MGIFFVYKADLNSHVLVMASGLFIDDELEREGKEGKWADSNESLVFVLLIYALW